MVGPQKLGEMATETSIQRLCMGCLKIGYATSAYQMAILNQRMGMLLDTRLSQALALEGSKKQAGYPQCWVLEYFRQACAGKDRV